jgi:hypothetical protein
MTRISALETKRPSLRVAVVEGKSSPRGWCPCRLGENISFTTAQLESYCLSSWKPLIFDAMVLAAGIEYCDRVRRRPALGWGRDFTLRVPVHDLALWNKPGLQDALHGALNFLTGDRWMVEFVARQCSESAPSQKHFDLPRGEVSIIPFSDGMDSRAVAGLEAQDLGDRLIRVRLGSKMNDRPEKSHLFTSVPYRVKIGERNLESSARSRGFKFAMVSGIAAFLVKANEIIVPESGQGALGPALVSVGHAYPDYRNHPLFTDRMAVFLSALFDHPIRYRFPRLWHTKGQTLAAFGAIGKIDPCLEARSCWQDSRQVSVDGAQRQCGVCAACMLRRLSVHAAGFAENTNTYVWDNLSASSFEKGAARGFDGVTDALREYAIAGVLHLDHLANLTNSPLHKPALTRLCYQLSQSLGMSQRDVESKLMGMLAEHRREWDAFLHSLGQYSYVRNWTSSSHEHAA